MFNKNIKVEEQRSTKRDCRYVYYVTGSDYKKDKKYVVEKRVCVGKMIDEEVMNPNENFFQFFELDGEEKELPEFSDALQIGSHTLVIKIMDDLGISELIRVLHREEGENLLKDLITYMIVRQTSAMQHYADFSWSHLISSKKHWDDTRISEYLKSDIDYAQIELFITQWNKLQPEHSGIYISYDSTNMNTAADGVEMAEYGHAKDDDELPQVNISYAVNHNDATAENKAIFDSKVKDIDDFIYNVYSKDVYETYANDKPDLVRIRTEEVVNWGDAFGDSFEKLNISLKK